nr:MAG TPA: hypothetical protein [Caudoviricetes sp.]DAU20563.1 MAG TPA: hypothetical protein [Caudoviricetes sp.]
MSAADSSNELPIKLRVAPAFCKPVANSSVDIEKLFKLLLSSNITLYRPHIKMYGA